MVEGPHCNLQIAVCGGNGGKGGALHQKVRNARFAEGTDSKGTVTTRINGTFEKIQSYGHKKGSAAN